jgi:selenide,water dikinase
MDIKLTSYSHGAGCGCKISPEVLERILSSTRDQAVYPGLLVGNAGRDDAAVFDLGEGKAVISTTDFFMPIVDDAFDFGRIAAANAVSDVYAMGGKPLMAIAILGWPVSLLPAQLAGQVMRGAMEVCAAVGMPLAGGHSIDTPEPIFGLAVTGLVDKGAIKTNDGAKEGDALYLTKPLGIGIVTTAQKKGMATEAHMAQAIGWMTKPNHIGALLGGMGYVHALTDVTGFGLLGHLGEMCQGSGVSATVYWDKIPLLHGAIGYLGQGAVPGGTERNWSSYGHRMGAMDMQARCVLADPQTSGGLLIAVDPVHAPDLERLLGRENVPAYRIGHMRPPARAMVELE